MTTVPLKFIWNETCQQAFEQIKAILNMVSLVFSSPNSGKTFVLQIAVRVLKVVL